MSEMLRLAFSGPGAVIPQMIGLGLASWIANAVLSAIGKAKYGSLIDVATVLICVSLVLNCIWQVIGKIF